MRKLLLITHLSKHLVDIDFPSNVWIMERISYGKEINQKYSLSTIS